MHYYAIIVLSDGPIVINIIDTLQAVEASDTVDMIEDYPQIYVGDNYKDMPFYVSLLTGDLVFAYCMLDWCTSNNIMASSVLRQLGSRIKMFM